MLRGIVSIIFLTIFLLPFVPARATKLLRFPDIHGNRVVFTYGGDLWMAPSGGGDARRLTAHPGLELFAKFSPDGKWIAFTGQYEGDEQVYVIPSAGGAPRQMTFYPAHGPLAPRWGYDNQVYGWHPDGDSVLFRSSRDSWDHGVGSLYLVSRRGGAPRPVGLPESGAGDFSPDGRSIFYSPLFRDFRTWKRYQGGWAQDLYVFDLKRRTARRITKNVRTDRDPMWIGKALYFASDRDGRLNLYRADPGGGSITQLTRHTGWDVRWPSAGPGGQIVYELDGELRVYETKKNRDRAIPIRVPSDEIPARPRMISAAGQVECFDLSPHGKRALFVARGDLFDTPIEHGLVRNLTASSNAHDREAQWSPDGKKMAFISDRTGEEELWWLDVDTGRVEQLSRGSLAHLYRPRFSPDGKQIAYSDHRGKIYVLQIKSRRAVEVADERYGRCRDYTWSPHGGHLAMSLRDANFFSSIYIWSVADGKLRRVTGPEFDEFHPAWDPAGSYLYYLSLRDFRPQMGGLDFNFVVNRATRIYALALRKDLPHPFPPQNDELDGKDDKKKGKDKDKGKWSFEKVSKAKPTRIDFTGLSGRVAAVPLPGANYAGLQVTGSHLVWLKKGPWFHGREEVEATLEAYSIKDRKPSTLAEKVRGFALSRDGTRALAMVDKAYQLIEIAGGEKEGKKPKQVSLDGLRVMVDPKQEWATAFDEVWRRFRDYFYVENMHGYDWKAIRKQYRPLLAHVAHRSDLNYLLGEMIAELNVSHAYVEGGDENPPSRPGVALPGARFELDERAGRYRISEIFSGHNQEKNYRAPLTEVGVDASVGDYLLAVNGVELNRTDNPYRLLRLPAEKPVELLLNRKPTLRGARRVIYRPVGSERDLLYLAWVQKNREKVSRATGGRVGYLHLPDMMSAGIREFVKWFFNQNRKEGLIVDVRSNGGGHVSELVIERLRRSLLMTSFGRHYDGTFTYPNNLQYGPKVCLINETSASDGDIFPHAFRQAGLGPLIGKRTWGGVIGITGHGPLIDGGQVYVPQFSTNAPDGRYIIEGRGVEPDIDVDNDPASVLKGQDRQLDRAIQEIMKQLKKKPARLPKRPPPPRKNDS